MKKRRTLLSVIIAAILLVMFPLQASAESNGLSMTMYAKAIKSGNTVYCIGDSGLYKISLKKGRPVKTKLLVKTDKSWKKVLRMVKKGRYIYFEENRDAANFVYRINIKTGKKKKLFESDMFYAIKGNRIYYRFSVEDEYDYDDETDEEILIKRGYEKVYSKKLDGTSKVTSDLKLERNVYRKSNTKGYTVCQKKNGAYIYDYLKTPKGRFYLGKKKKNDY